MCPICRIRPIGPIFFRPRADHSRRHLPRNVDYGGTFSNFVGAALSGLPVRIVMSAMDGSDHYLVTVPSVKRVEDLKGKIFGISSFGGTPHREGGTILRNYGMNPEKDVTFLQ